MDHVESWLPWVLLFLNIVLILGGVYLKTFVESSAKELATKRNISELTTKVEEVKADYAKALEEFKSGLWTAQQKQVWMREEYKVKLDVFKRASRIVSELETAMTKAQALHKHREIQIAKHNVAFKNNMNGVDLDTAYRAYLQYIEQAIDAARQLAATRSDLVEIRALVSVYFDEEHFCLVHAIIEKSLQYDLLHWDRVEFERRVGEEVLRRAGIEENAAEKLNHAGEEVSRQYDQIVNRLFPREEINNFFHKQRADVAAMRAQV